MVYYCLFLRDDQFIREVNTSPFSESSVFMEYSKDKLQDRSLKLLACHRLSAVPLTYSKDQKSVPCLISLPLASLL